MTKAAICKHEPVAENAERLRREGEGATARERCTPEKFENNKETQRQIACRLPVLVMKKSVRGKRKKPTVTKSNLIRHKYQYCNRDFGENSSEKRANSAQT
jgi:hypothetical protein